MYSQFANQATIQSQFQLAPELEKFAYEFCKAFNCTIYDLKESRYPAVGLAMPDGIPVGRLMVNMNGERDKETGKHIPVYYYESPLVNKMKEIGRAHV